MFPTKNLVKSMLLANFSVFLFVAVLAAFGVYSNLEGSAKNGQKHHGDTSVSKKPQRIENQTTTSKIDLNFNLFFNVFNY